MFEAIPQTPPEKFSPEEIHKSEDLRKIMKDFFSVHFDSQKADDIRDFIIDHPDYKDYLLSGLLFPNLEIDLQAQNFDTEEGEFEALIHGLQNDELEEAA